jgi:hypothetical protein
VDPVLVGRLSTKRRMLSSSNIFLQVLRGMPKFNRSFKPCDSFTHYRICILSPARYRYRYALPDIGLIYKYFVYLDEILATTILVTR